MPTYESHHGNQQHQEDPTTIVFGLPGEQSNYLEGEDKLGVRFVLCVLFFLILLLIAIFSFLVFWLSFDAEANAMHLPLVFGMFSLGGLVALSIFCLLLNREHIGWRNENALRPNVTEISGQEAVNNDFSSLGGPGNRGNFFANLFPSPRTGEPVMESLIHSEEEVNNERPGV